jgi:hypothetical protein
MSETTNSVKSSYYAKKIAEQRRCKDQLLHDKLVVIQELEEKCVRDVHAARVLHANDLQHYNDQIAESDRNLLKAQEDMQLLEETHRQDLERAKETNTKELQRREGDENQVIQKQNETKVLEKRRVRDPEKMKEEYTEEL